MTRSTLSGAGTPHTNEAVLGLDLDQVRGLRSGLMVCGTTSNSDKTTIVAGLCAGYQMLGCRIDDDLESSVSSCDGLGHLPDTTSFEDDNVLTCRTAHALGAALEGYQIHHGRVRRADPATDARTPEVWLHLDSEEGNEQLDRLADHLAESIDLPALLDLIGSAR